MATENQLRDALRRQRKQVADLRKRVKDKYLRNRLKSASGTLDFVELCLSPDSMARSRDARSVLWWLGQTKSLLDAASAETKFVEDVLEKFGDDAKSFPS